MNIALEMMEVKGHKGKQTLDMECSWKRLLSRCGRISNAESTDVQTKGSFCPDFLKQTRN